MKLLILILFVTIAWAKPIDYKTFEANFEQTITNTSKNVIFYSGNIKASKQNILWQYEKPISKEVYVLGNDVIINEPELEQTIYTKLKNEINIVTLLSEAKKIDDNKYSTLIGDTEYILSLKDGVLLNISFKDEVENRVIITFKNQKINKDIDSKTFLFDQDPNFDIIKQ